QWPLPRRVEQPLGGEPALQLLQLREQGADAGDAHLLDDQLVLAARLVDADLAERLDFQAVFRLERELHGLHAVHGALELRGLVLELEVVVPARVRLEPGQLPLHPHAGERAAQQVLDRARDLADREDAIFGRGQRGHGQTLTVALWRSAAITVERTTIATVIGPTPPGTGVTAPATWRTASKSTSPV